MSCTFNLFYLVSIIVCCVTFAFLCILYHQTSPWKALNQVVDKYVTNGSMNNNKPDHVGLLKLFNSFQLSTEATHWNIINLLHITIIVALTGKVSKAKEKHFLIRFHQIFLKPFHWLWKKNPFQIQAVFWMSNLVITLFLVLKKYFENFEE